MALPGLLYGAGDRFSTTLNGGITDSDLSVTLSSVAGLNSNGGVLILDKTIGASREIIYYSSIAGNVLTIPSGGRGIAGTSAVAHSSGAAASDVIISDHINELIEKFVVDHTTAGAHKASLALTTPAITGGTVAGATLTTATITSVSAWGDNQVTGNSLATNAIKLGLGTRGSDAATSSGTAADISLGVTVTVPAGGRSVKITAYAASLSNNTNAQYVEMSIWDGTVGSGTQLNKTTEYIATANTPKGGLCMAVVTPAAGSKTYNVGLSNASTSGAATLQANATYPAFILVELI